MSAIGAGDWLEAVSSSISADASVSVEAGRIYRCRSLVSPESGGTWRCIKCSSVFALAVDLDCWAVTNAWCRCLFKAAGYRPSAEVLEALSAEPLVDA